MSLAEDAAPPRPALLTHDSPIATRYRLARQAQASWATLSVAERARRLSRVADLLLERRDDLVALIRDENGKPMVEADAHEIGPSVAIVRWLCAQAPAVLAPRELVPAAMPIRRVTVTQEPLGVVLVIAPWNIPLSIPLGQVMSALVAGNAVILKPSEITPRIGAALGDLIAACDVPEHLFAVVQGDGAVGAELIAAGPDKVLFTGSLATGRKVMAAAAEHPIPVSLELGGVDALIVDEGADLEVATSAIAFGGTFNHGQVCASVERVLVPEPLLEVVVDWVASKLAATPPGDLGRICNPGQRAVYERHLADARRRGLQVRGGAWRDAERLEPAVVSGEGIEQAAVWQEETFGPVIAVASWRDDDELLARAQAGPFGLTASVFAGSPERAEALAGRLRVGAVSIGDLGATLHAYGDVPWGGVDGSGFGRSHGPEGLLECTWPKVVDRPRAGLTFKRPWWFPYDPDLRDLMAAFSEAVGHRSFRRRARAWLRAGRALLRQGARTPRL